MIIFNACQFTQHSLCIKQKLRLVIFLRVHLMVLICMRSSFRMMHSSSKDFIHCWRETLLEVAIVFVSRDSVLRRDRQPLKILNNSESVCDLINSAEPNLPHPEKQMILRVKFQVPPPKRLSLLDQSNYLMSWTLSGPFSEMMILCLSDS